MQDYCRIFLLQRFSVQPITFIDWFSANFNCIKIPVIILLFLVSLAFFCNFASMNYAPKTCFYHIGACTMHTRVNISNFFEHILKYVHFLILLSIANSFALLLFGQSIFCLIDFRKTKVSRYWNLISPSERYSNEFYWFINDV